MNYKKFIISWLPVILWSIIIFFFSSLPTIPASTVYWREFAIKKTAHVIEYGIFAMLLYRAFRIQNNPPERSGLYAILVAIFYAMSDELHQSFTPGREPTLRDILFDTIGAILSILIIWNILPKLPKKLRIWGEKLQLS